MLDPKMRTALLPEYQYVKNKKTPGFARGSVLRGRSHSEPCSQRLDVRGLLALRADLDVERDTLVLLQRLEAVGADFREVREQIVAACVRRDEAKPFASLNHLTIPVSMFQFPSRFLMTQV